MIRLKLGSRNKEEQLYPVLPTVKIITAIPVALNQFRLINIAVALGG